MLDEAEEEELLTPNKAACSPVVKKNLEFGQVTILSNSRFLVLSDANQAEELT